MTFSLMKLNTREQNQKTSKVLKKLLHSRLDVSTVSGGTDDVAQAEKVWNMQLQLDMEGTLTTH